MSKGIKSKSGSDELVDIPGVGQRIAEHMRDIGVNSVDDLKGKNAEQLYAKLCDFRASPVDRCMLYVLRCAIYYAENTEHDLRLLKWWNWKD